MRCTTGEAFTNDFLDSLGAGRTEAFKARFRDVDVLLLDDVQFLQRKAKTEEEFFHTFNALHDGGRQIVVTSDRPPHDLQALEDRLRERFEAGLVADVTPPDLATRVAILRKRADHDGVQLSDEQALLAIAERIDSNVRALEGALIRVVAFSSLTGRPLTAELAREVLDTLYPRSTRRGLRPADARSPRSRPRSARTSASPPASCSPRRAPPRISWPRQIAMYLARELTGESLPAIGRHSAGAITPPFCTPGAAPPRASPTTAMPNSCGQAVPQPRSSSWAVRSGPDRPHRLRDCSYLCTASSTGSRPSRPASTAHPHIHSPY